ncbi:MAG: hypothetical protein M3Z24_04485 [Chloroflexota bacterium]|nr:hypothetical protein [Chloroflexota bacterium]
MKRYQSYGEQPEEIDEHDQPTEPMAKIVLAPFSQTIQSDRGVPAPQPQERPFPRQNSYPSREPEQGVPTSRAYPYLPPAPTSNKGQQPVGGASSGYPQLPPQANRVQPYQPKWSPVPMFVGLCFVIIQLLLLIRFVLKMLGWSADSVWVHLVYDSSSLFAFPFQLLLQNIALSFPSNIEISTLLAILIYGFFSRILVRFLKAVLHSR